MISKVISNNHKKFQQAPVKLHFPVDNFALQPLDCLDFYRFFIYFLCSLFFVMFLCFPYQKLYYIMIGINFLLHLYKFLFAAATNSATCFTWPMGKSMKYSLNLIKYCAGICVGYFHECL